MKQLGPLVFIAFAACADSSPTEFADAIVNCEFGRAATLPIGGVLSATGASRFCLELPGGGTFVLVPFVAGARDTSARVTVSVYGTGLTQAPGIEELQRTKPAGAPGYGLTRIIQSNDAWETALRAREDLELSPLLRPGSRPPAALTAPAPARLRGIPDPGDELQLNVATSCTEVATRRARVVAVTRRAIVTYDPTNPSAQPFTESDLQTFGREFDEITYPTITQNFGAETDLDGNGRVILFFTRAVNEVVPPGSRTGVVIGFFYRGDVFPRAGIPGRTDPCPASNEGEVLYLSVPDPEGEVRGVPINYSTLNQVMTGTIAHEFQHLINSGRRVHVTNANSLEETWLNEALSHIAEELMFYTLSGIAPRQNVDTTLVQASNARREAFNRFAYSNLGRFDRFIQSAQDWSPMGADGQETRGATWSFLRYVADRDPRPDAPFFRALVDGPGAGVDNLRSALGQDPLPWMQDWSVSVFADDLVPGSDARYQQPSWNMRNLITALRIIDRRYPLRTLPLESGQGFAVKLRIGSAAYPVFSVEAGQRAFVVLGVDGATGDKTVRAVLMRVR